MTMLLAFLAPLAEATTRGGGSTCSGACGYWVPDGSGGRTLVVDGDCDSWLDADDNCPVDENPDQTDTDADQLGDPCDDDDDGDGIADPGDNCPLARNPTQRDTDSDGIGDACDYDTDYDADGVVDPLDNCPDDANPQQEDANQDGIGDVCDVDGDGVHNVEDNCPTTPNPLQEDADEDGTGDACADRDGDGVLDVDDNCPDVYNGWQSDLDSDGLGDECDPDRDADGIDDQLDLCWYEQEDGGFFGLGGPTDPADGCPDRCIDPMVDAEADFHAGSNPATGRWVYGRYAGAGFFANRYSGTTGAPNFVRNWRAGANLSALPRVSDTDAYGADESPISVTLNGTTYPADALVLQPALDRPAVVRYVPGSSEWGRLVTMRWSMTSARTSGTPADVEVYVAISGDADLDLDGLDDTWFLTGFETDAAGTTGAQEFTFYVNRGDVVDFVVDGHGGLNTNFDTVSLRVEADDTCPYFDYGESA